MSGTYQLIPTSNAREQLVAIFQWARLAEKPQEYANALLWIISELERTPLEFGEGHYALEDSGVELKFRTAFAGRVMVRFAVREATKQVFISRYRAWF